MTIYQQKLAILFAQLTANRTDYHLTSQLFLRLLAVIYLIAFSSLAVQIVGLVGENGILPFSDVLDNTYQLSGWKGWLQLPTLFWFNVSDKALLVSTLVGIVFSFMLLVGVFEQWASIILFVLYLSLYHAGQIFLSFQWDSLLLEAGCLAMFLVSGPTLLIIFMYEWLLFRFRFMSGLSKLISGDPSWANFTALDYYFETQPLPHIGSWYAYYWPHWLHQLGVGFTFFTELVVPFLIFLPRPFRIAAALITFFMQLLIISTSNHGFVNLLVMVLCVLLLDDRILNRFSPRALLPWLQRDYKKVTWYKHSLTAIFGLVIVFVSTSAFIMVATQKPLPKAIVQFDSIVQAWGVGHIYHIFPTMQRERQELIIQGSNDGQHWLDYEFNYKPGNLSDGLNFIVPYHPRLDWMMWFVPTQSARQLNWFRKFEHRLKQGAPEVLALLKTNPFPNKPPRFLRVQAYAYHFSSVEDHQSSGRWWQRDYIGVFPYVPPRHP